MDGSSGSLLLPFLLLAPVTGLDELLNVCNSVRPPACHACAGTTLDDALMSFEELLQDFASLMFPVSSASMLLSVIPSMLISAVCASWFEKK